MPVSNENRFLPVAGWMILGFLAAVACVEPPPSELFDPLGLVASKDFVALRSSSNNPNPASNDDSKSPIPGETTVLAELEGPGEVTHFWITVAATSTDGRGSFACASTTTGADVPSVDAPLGDFFGVGHGFESPVSSLMVRVSSDGRARNSFWPMPFRKSCSITVTNEGSRRVRMLYYHVDWHKLPSIPEGHALLSRMLSSGASQLGWRPLHLNGSKEKATTWAPCSR